MALFLDRARAVRPHLQLDAKTMTEIADICRHVDGLPLALELAAARIRSLNPADIGERVRTHLDLLSSDRRGRRPSCERSATVLDWSYGLLNDDARRALRSLSCSPAPSILSRRSGLFGSRHRAARGSRSADLLVDASMMTVGGPKEPFDTRCWRRFGITALSIERRPQAEKVRCAHAHHYVHAAEQADRGLRGPDEALWV